MNRSLRRTFCMLIIPVSIAVAGSSAFAGQSSNLFRVELEHAVERASALVFAEHHVLISPAHLEKQSGGKIAAEVLLTPDPLFQRRFITVVGVGKGAVRTYTNVQEASDHNGDENITAFCSESPRRAAHEQLPLLKPTAVSDLVQVRKRKRDVLAERLRSELTPSVLETLRAAEEAYGLGGSPELAQDMPMDELLRRLEAIQSMAQNRLARKRE
ncbi:MAG: hypothetical protein U0136_00440 [Bdellovibrionota bacterium]